MFFISTKKRSENDREVVECTTCGALIQEFYAQKVEHTFSSPDYYCKEHRVPWDICEYGTRIKKVAVIVDENGQPISKNILKDYFPPKKQ